MAEGFLRAFGGDEYEAHSAGTKPSLVNPLAMQVMDEVGSAFPGSTRRMWPNTWVSIFP